MLQNVQPNWNETDSTSDAFIKNKPTIPAAQVQADWDESDSSDVAFILNKPVLATVATTGNYLDLNNIDVDYLGFVYSRSYLYDMTVQLTKEGSPNDINLEYSLDKNTWTNYTIGTTITLTTNGATVYFRGNNPNGFSKDQSNYYKFVINSSSNTYRAIGNIMSLVDKSAKMDSIPNNYCFYSLFTGCQRLQTCPKLPATNLKQGCYHSLFKGTMVATPCELPANSVNYSSYCQMFQNCTYLERAPELNASVVRTDGYRSMFEGCTSLVSIPDTIWCSPQYADERCFQNMFSGCTKLTKTPKTLITYNRCCEGMFQGCTSLVDASELFIEDATHGSCKNLFYGCTNLVKAPKKLTVYQNGSGDYYQMFCGCSNLEIAPEIITNGRSIYCSGMFADCTKLKYVKCDFTSWPTDTSSWLRNVSENGVFDCSASLDTTTRDVSHVPSGWTVTHGSNEPSDDTTSTVEAMSTDVYTVCAGSTETGVLTVDSALKLNAMPNANTEIAYAEVVIDLGSNATVTAGSNIRFVDTLEAGKRNVCVVRWSGGQAKLYVTIVEDLDESASN